MSNLYLIVSCIKLFTFKLGAGRDGQTDAIILDVHGQTDGRTDAQFVMRPARGSAG